MKKAIVASVVSVTALPVASFASGGAGTPDYVLHFIYGAIGLTLVALVASVGFIVVGFREDAQGIKARLGEVEKSMSSLKATCAERAQIYRAARK